MIRILLSALALSAGACGVVFLAIFGFVEWQTESAAQQASAHAQVESVADVVALGADADQLRAAIARTIGGEGGELAVHLPNGTTIGSLRADGYGTTIFQSVPTSNGVCTVAAFLPIGGVIGPVLRRIGLLIGAGVPTLALAVAVGYRRTRRLVSATRAVVAAAGTIGQSRTGVEVPAIEASEFSALIGALNEVSLRVERLITNEREIVADLSHRLRTPLTALRLDSESIADGPVGDRIRLTLSAMEKDVDELIRGAERTMEPAPSSCDVARVVSDRMAFWSVLADHQGRWYEYHGDTSPAPVRLAAKDIGAVVDSLIGNIFQHTPPGTPFAAAVVCHAGWVSLVVEDGGTGVPDSGAALRRGISGRGSTGLGLDIARQAAEATGGTVHIDRGRLGGARIRLRFGEAGAHHPATAPRAWRLWSRTPTR
jgi:signal transduction histidine kinase